LIIHGRVQGVGFRYATLLEARRLKLSGWVRNRRDGTVEALVCGPAEAVETLIAWAQRGPPAARVERVEVSDSPESITGEFEQGPTI